MLFRPGNAGANTVADHITLLTEALIQVSGSSQAKIAVRVDGAGATHDLLKHVEALKYRPPHRAPHGRLESDRADDQAIALFPKAAWQDSLRQDGDVQDGYHCAELTGLGTREGWPTGMRLIVSRGRPPGRQPPTPDHPTVRTFQLPELIAVLRASARG